MEYYYVPDIVMSTAVERPFYKNTGFTSALNKFRLNYTESIEKTFF